MFKSLVATALLMSHALALPEIAVKGAKFFADGQQFFLKGVAYQGTPADPLVDTTQCQLDAAAMRTIGTNSIRVYHVDPYSNHDGCMSAFESAGIYIWLDLDTFNTTITQTSPEWNQEQFLAFAQVMDVFEPYDNLGGFWIGNEVINTATGSSAAPYVKAAVADMKSYMSAKSYRQVPIGYSAADIAELRPMLQNYLACGSSADQAIDFYGLNSYEWCGTATYTTSGYSNLQAMAQGYSVPMFFSETGCNVGGERTFGDQNAIFGPEMIDTWSGSIIYEWVQEANDYGLVTYPNNEIYSGAPTPMQPDYDNISNVWKTISPTGVAESDYTASYSAPACPLATGGWAVNGDVPLPTLAPSIIKAAAAASALPNASAAPASSKLTSAASSSITSGMRSNSTQVLISASVHASIASSVFSAYASAHQNSTVSSKFSTSIIPSSSGLVMHSKLKAVETEDMKSLENFKTFGYDFPPCGYYDNIAWSTYTTYTTTGGWEMYRASPVSRSTFHTIPCQSIFPGFQFTRTLDTSTVLSTYPSSNLVLFTTTSAVQKTVATTDVAAAETATSSSSSAIASATKSSGANSLRPRAMDPTTSFSNAIISSFHTKGQVIGLAIMMSLLALSAVVFLC